ncbi:MAG: lamin tail domain-containing protein [Methanomicrobia archaeon]|nr:lamin tail domain-containing protein [Methanomicrobia archaeon]
MLDDIDPLEKTLLGICFGVLIGCLIFGSVFYQYDPRNPIPIWETIGLTNSSSQPHSQQTAQTTTPTPEQTLTPTLSPTPTAIETPTPAPTEENRVYISDLDLQNEWVKITNTGTSPVTLTKWKITDDGAKHTYIFPSFTLSSGATVTLYTRPGSDSATELYWGSGSSIWNVEGDTATLYDASGDLVDQLKA